MIRWKERQTSWSEPKKAHFEELAVGEKGTQALAHGLEFCLCVAVWLLGKLFPDILKHLIKK